MLYCVHSHKNVHMSSFYQFLQIKPVGLGFELFTVHDLSVFFLPRTNLFVLGLVLYVFVHLFVINLVVVTTAVDCLERLVSEITCCLSNAVLNFACSLIISYLYNGNITQHKPCLRYVTVVKNCLFQVGET